MIRRSTKEGMHPRNHFRGGYDFKDLVRSTPGLAAHVRENAHGDLSINYADSAAVQALNQALLRQAFGLVEWGVPRGSLCPPVPGRSDYIHHVADLLRESRPAIPRGAAVRVLDIGIGASCIYPLIGASAYGWSFVGSDIDQSALDWARRILAANPRVAGLVECRLQTDRSRCFSGVILEGETFDVSICNPPFHASATDALAGNERKRRNLGLLKAKTPARNFGGQGNELWCPGGELGFITRMIAQSVEVRERCGWFTTLVATSGHLRRIESAAREAGAVEVRVIDMAQGQKRSRILAWRFASGDA
jgi:23S rRNA (adenine1618-N6)-methyltransferase